MDEVPSLAEQTGQFLPEGLFPSSYLWYSSGSPILNWVIQEQLLKIVRND